MKELVWNTVSYSYCVSCVQRVKALMYFSALRNQRRIPDERAIDVIVDEVEPAVWNITIHTWNCGVLPTFSAIGVSRNYFIRIILNIVTHFFPICVITMDKHDCRT